MRHLLRSTTSLAIAAVLATGCGPLIRSEEGGGVVTVEVTDPVDLDGAQDEGADPDGSAAPTFGFLVAIDETEGRIALDPAEWLTGDAAVEAARAAGDLGEGETDVPNGYYILNGEVDEVWLTLDPAAQLFVMTNAGDPTTETQVDVGGLADWLAANPVSPFQLATTSSGAVTELRFVYRP